MDAPELVREYDKVNSPCAIISFSGSVDVEDTAMY